MTEITKSIMEAMAKIGEEKMGSLKSAEELQALLKEAGVTATPEEIAAAVAELGKGGKQELSEDTLEQVAGGAGADWGAILEKLPEFIDMFGKLFGGKKDGEGGGESKPSTPTNTQDNSNNSGNQQVTQNGDNNMGGGMSQTKK